MKQEQLRLYKVDIKYIRDLSKADDNVPSVSPQIQKDTRPFIGIIVICGDKKYCVPLSSPKPKHEKMNNDKDFSKIYDKHEKLIGVLNFNLMIPVDKSVVSAIDFNIVPNDSPKIKAYKNLLKDQLNWCRKNREQIISKAEKLYILVTRNPERARNLVKRCCDYCKLERVLEKRNRK